MVIYLMRSYNSCKVLELVEPLAEASINYLSQKLSPLWKACLYSPNFYTWYGHCRIISFHLSQASYKFSPSACWNEKFSFLNFAVRSGGNYLVRNLSANLSHVVIDPVSKYFNHDFVLSLRVNGNRWSLTVLSKTPFILKAPHIQEVGNVLIWILMWQSIE